MKTLVIHPEDSTTVSLKRVYVNHPEFTVINDCNISKEELVKAIEEHDRIIMLGHGTHYGLINPRRGYWLLIDDTFANLLREKETISVWCHSDAYFKRNNIPGFHTGMIISETKEELMELGHAPLNQEQMDKNMDMLSDAIGESLDMSPRDMQQYVLEHYVGDDEVTQYNRRRIIVL